MRSTCLRRTLPCFALLLVAACLVVPVRADEDPQVKPQPSGRGPSSLGSEARRWLQRFARPRSGADRNHSSLKLAFEKVTRDPARSTVRVYADGRHVALGGVVDEAGYVLTKASELYGTIECALPDGQRFPAEIVGAHRETDLAMLKLDAPNLDALDWADEESPKIGSWMITPFGKSGMLTFGVLSVPPRRIASPRGMLGVRLGQGRGAPRVETVMPNSAAKEAGVKANDIITHVNGVAMESQSKLINTIRKFLPGERVRLEIDRSGEKVRVTVVLGSATMVNMRQHQQNNLAGPKMSKRNAGFPSAMQHDAALHPYQCGGPVVNLNGEVVGINIAHMDRVASLALPNSVILPLLDDLKSGKLAPGLSAVDRQLAAEQAEELRSRIKRWTTKLAQLQESLRESQMAEAEARKAAESSTDDVDTAKRLEQLKRAKLDIERAFEETKQSLEKASSELQMVESKVSVNSQGGK